MQREPKVVTGWWLTEQYIRCLDAAENCIVMYSSLGYMIPGCQRAAKRQQLLVDLAMEYGKRLKKLVEPPKKRR